MSRGLGHIQQRVLEVLDDQLGTPTTFIVAAVFDCGDTITESQYRSVLRALRSLEGKSLVIRDAMGGSQQTLWRKNDAKQKLEELARKRLKEAGIDPQRPPDAYDRALAEQQLRQAREQEARRRRRTIRIVK